MSRIRQKSNKLITSIDIGSSKVCCIIAEITGDVPKIIGIGHHGISGIKQGVSPNMETIENAILNAVHKAEKGANLTVKNAIINISGKHLLSEIMSVTTDIKGHAVGEADIRKLLMQGTNTNPGKDFSILHANPIRFSIDKGQSVTNPRGMYGNTLTGHLHIVTGALNPTRNIVNCLRRCHIDVRGIVPSAIASGFSTLVEDEIDLGVILVDMGSHHTNVAIFMDGEVVHTDSIPLGGVNITNDLAQGLATSLSAAERIKILHGSAIETTEDSRVMVEVPPLDGQQTPVHVRRSLVTSIVKPRVEEILEMIRRRLEKSDVYKMTSRRVVLTGGTSQLPGLRELTQKILHKQARLGKPLDAFKSRDPYSFPSFATCTGLLTFALRQNYSEQEPRGVKKSWVTPLIKWFKDNF